MSTGPFFDPLTQFLITIVVTILGSGLQMTESKRLGVVLIVLSLGSLWWLLVQRMVEKHLLDAPSFFPWITTGWIIIALIGLVWIEKLTHSAPASIPTTQASSTNQSVSVAGDYNTVFYNQALNVQSKTIQELNNTLSTYYNEGRALLKKYEVSLNVSGADAKKWSQKVVRCLRNTLKDDSYAVQFEKDKEDSRQERETEDSMLALKGVPRENRKIHRYISTRLYQLYEIMKEIRG